MSKRGVAQTSRRQADQSLRRQSEVADRHLAGQSMPAIANAMGLTVRTVYRDLERARGVWEQRASNSYAALRAEKLAQLQQVRQQAWQGWKRSLKIDRSKTQSDTTHTEGYSSTTTKRTAKANGDPRFLATITAALHAEMKLLGLLGDAPDNAGGEAPRVMTVVVEDREQRDQILSYGEFQQKIVHNAAS